MARRRRTVTPNHVHYPAAKAFLERGIHVILRQPLTSNLEDAKKLKEAADKADALFVLTHNYTGYPAWSAMQGSR